MRHFRLRAAACCVLALGLAGCGSRPDNSRYIPSVPTAQTALETALSAWRSGQSGPLKIADPSVAVEIIDAQRKPGQRLADFKIEGEESAEGPRCFVVSLKLENPAETLQARYYVVGLDPLWIMRQEDYDMVNHWDCEMPPADELETQPPKTTNVASTGVERTDADGTVKKTGAASSSPAGGAAP